MTATHKNKLVKMDLAPYDTSKMTFGEPKNVTTKSGFSFDTVAIGTVNPDGSEGDLIIRSVPDLFCKGLEKAKDYNDAEKFKWQLPLSFQDRNPSTGLTDPTPEQAAWMANFDAIMQQCIDWVMANLMRLGLDEEFQAPRLKDFTPMYYAKVKDPKTGKPTKRIAEGAGPWLYTKVMWNPETNEFGSQFFDKSDQELTPDSIVDRHFKATVALKIESLFINGNRIHPQVKLFESVMEEIGSARVRILGEEDNCVRLNSQPRVKVMNSTDSASPLDEDEDDDDDDGSVGEPVEEEEPEPVVEVPKKKKVLRKKKLSTEV